MHEMGIMSGVLDSVNTAAQNAQAERVTKIILNIGEMTEIIQYSLEFAFQVMSEGTLSEGAELVIKTVTPHSICLDCGHEFDHDRFHRTCPECGSYSTSMTRGRELDIESIEVDLPDAEDASSEAQRQRRSLTKPSDSVQGQKDASLETSDSVQN